MPSKWQVWAQPDGSLVWVPVSDAPPSRPPPPPPPPAGASACPPDPAPPHPPPLDDAPTGETLGPGGRRMTSMADLLLEALDKLIEGNGTDVLTEGANTGGLFSTGSGRSVALSEKAVRRARVLVGEEDEAANNNKKSKQPFDDDAGLDGERANLDVPLGGCVDGMEQFPMFQTGSGRAVSISMASVQKAKAVLEESNINTGNVEGPGRLDQSLIFQTGSRRPEGSIERSKAVLMDEGQRDTGCQRPIFQTGLGRPVAVKQSSIKKERAVLEDGDVKRSGNGDTSVCATSFQFETPTSVLMSSSLITNDRTVTPEENTSVRGKFYKDDGHLPLFQTGSGRSVTVSKGSIKRASAILGSRNIAKELEDEAHLSDGCATSIFKTGVGRILANENSREKAQVVLEAKEAVNRVNSDIGDGLAENPMSQAGIHQFSPANKRSRAMANTLLEQGNFATKGRESPLPMFQTGSGKSVLVSESSVQKTRAVLEEEADVTRENCKLVQMDKKFPVFVSPLKTSCARTVNISSAGVSRAATLLGLEENTLSTQFFGHVGDKLGAKITVKRGNPEHRLDIASAHVISGDPHKGFCPTENSIHTDRHQQFGFSKSTDSDGAEHSIRVSTAGGRSMAFSTDALQRAKSLLGDSDLLVSPNDSVGCSLAPAKEKLPNSTISPKGDESYLSHRTRELGYAVPDTLVMKGNPNKFHMAREYRPMNEFPKVPKPPSSCLPEVNKARDPKDKTQRHHMSAGPLVDITNYIATCSGNTEHCANGKRIIRGRNPISPFKRPRSSKSFDLHPV